MLVRRLAVSKGNPDELDDLLAMDFVNHDPLPGSTPDRQGYKQSLGRLVNALPDLTVSIEDIVAEGDRVAVRVIERGTQRGPLMGIARSCPPTATE